MTPLILRGIPGAPGRVSGVVDPQRDSSGRTRMPKIAVVQFTTPIMYRSLLDCSALVSELGGSTSHAVIIARELGIPCVVGISHAREALQPGMMVTVDGTEGWVRVDS